MFSGIILGILSAISFIVSFKKLPKLIQRRLRRYRVFMDLFSAFIFFITLSAISKSVASVFGAIVGSLIVDLFLWQTDFLEEDVELKKHLDQRLNSLGLKLRSRLRELLLSTQLSGGRYAAPLIQHLAPQFRGRTVPLQGTRQGFESLRSHSINRRDSVQNSSLCCNCT